jgi:hypothetical protein
MYIVPGRNGANSNQSTDRIDDSHMRLLYGILHCPLISPLTRPKHLPRTDAWAILTPPCWWIKIQQTRIIFREFSRQKPHLCIQNKLHLPQELKTSFHFSWCTFWLTKLPTHKIFFFLTCHSCQFQQTTFAVSLISVL